MTARRFLLAALACVALAACARGVDPSFDPDAGVGPRPDRPTPTDRGPLPDGALDRDVAPADEGTPGECTPGETRRCFTGPMEARGVGACRDGSQTCDRAGAWPAACDGEVLPRGMELCGNSMDDDCNGMVDDACGACMPGESRMCYTGPAGTMGTGTCRQGAQTCTAMREWPATCSGEQTPRMEDCATSLDEDCDGTVNNGCGVCTPGMTRPCYTGPSGTMGTGTCRGGTQTCTSARDWPATCAGEVTPRMEDCATPADEDCDGTANNGCGVCTPGMTRTCYTGPAGTAGRGICRNGTQTCTSARDWPTTCTGEVLPRAEACGNAADDDCDGMVDEGCCAAPTNSTCLRAQTLTIGAGASGDTTCAGNEHTSTCGGGGAGNDVAYVFASDGSPSTYTITTNTTSHDGVLHVHSASACTSATQIACNDDNGSTRQSQVVLANLPRGSFYVVQDGYSSTANGPFTLTSSRAAINHDTCATPARITLNGTYTGTTTGRVANYTGTCGSTASAPDVVYVFTATRTSSVTINTAGSTFDTVLYVGTSCGTAGVACNDDSGGLQSSVTFTATAGTTYYVVVDGFGSGSGTYNLTVMGL